VGQRVVIADAGPLIALASVDSRVLLRDLFGRVCITTTVRDEILPATSAFADADLLSDALADGWVDKVETPASDWKPLNPGIDPGEISAIQTACHRRDAGDFVLLVMDDRAGRLEASRCGIALIGTAAVIGLAKSEGPIPAAAPLLRRLTASGYFLGPAVIAAVLGNVGE